MVAYNVSVEIYKPCSMNLLYMDLTILVMNVYERPCISERLSDGVSNSKKYVEKLAV